MPCLHYLHGFKRSPLARRELENRGEVTNQLVIVKVLWRCDVGFFLLVPFFSFPLSTLSLAGGVGGTLRLPARDSPFFFLPSLSFHLSSSLAGGVGGKIAPPGSGFLLFLSSFSFLLSLFFLGRRRRGYIAPPGSGFPLVLSAFSFRSWTPQ